MQSEDTVTLIVSFTLVLLGMHPHIQETVSKEIYDIIGDKHDIHESNIDKLEYLDMVIRDVLRLFPIASFLVRKSEKEVTMFGKNISIFEGQNVHNRIRTSNSRPFIYICVYGGVRNNSFFFRLFNSRKMFYNYIYLQYP